MRFKLATFLLFTLGFSLFVPAVSAQEQNINTPVQVEQAATESLLGAVKRAKALLQSEVDKEEADAKKKAVTVTSREVALKIKLALWNETNGEIEIVEVKKNKSDILTLSNYKHNFILKRNNGVNSEFGVVGEPTLHVLAVKHPIFVDVGTKRHPKWRLDNVVYVPYSDFLNKPEIIKAGEEYLNRNVTAVYDELRSLGLHSRAFPDKLLADAIEPNVIKAILAIEHVSARALLLGNVNDYLNIFYTTLASNEHTAYAYAVSSAQARGLVQFIPSTYAILVKTRPDLMLDKKFERAMVDPFNAIKAQLGLLDINLTLLPNNARQKYESNAEEIGALLAAIYNGGSTRVRRALKQWGDDWSKDHSLALANLKNAQKSQKIEIARLKKLLAKKNLAAKDKSSYKTQLSKAQRLLNDAAFLYTEQSKANLKAETVLYVAKFHLMYKYLTSGEQ